MTFFFFLRGRPSSGPVGTGVPGVATLAYRAPVTTMGYALPGVSVAYAKPTTSLVITL